jgi:hypothetical protein
MKIFYHMAILAACFSLFTGMAKGQNEWPRTLVAADGSLIRIYEPQPESLQGNTLKFRSAFSFSAKDENDPVFGTFWAVANMETDRDSRLSHIVSVKVPNLKLAHEPDNNGFHYNYVRADIEKDLLKNDLETGMPHLNINFSLDALLASLDVNTEEKSLSKGLNIDAPKIIYETRPSLLVVIDGEPMIRHNDDWGIDVVVNTPYTIVRDGNGRFYLYGAKHWYEAPNATGPYVYVRTVPSGLGKVQRAVDAAENSNAGYVDSAAAADTLISNIIVRTEPAELIQSNGEPVFAAIPGTGLEYIVNSGNDIFRVSASGQYYVLLSGRWYRSGNIQGNWQYVPADGLPADFAKIPEGSPKDHVLASVAGTPAAREAVMDAQIPQTARIDRNGAQAKIVYDGAPQFADIPGTHLQYAMNSPSPVVRYQDRYYAVDKGVWFESESPAGPWKVCTKRPEEVDLIPPTCPVYNIKYVYIYDVTPEWVYMGYTPGYLNSFIFGPTVVYGTGFYYHPWRGRFFYPGPCTWGFNMRYDPWAGWTFGFDYKWDWFNWDFAWSWGGWFGGWWGPVIYRPPYMGRVFFDHGVYGRNAFLVRDRFFNYDNNIYRIRQGVVDRETPASLTTDRDGNIYRRNAQGGWEQRQEGAWRAVNDGRARANLETQERQRDRGLMRSRNFQMVHDGIFGGGRPGDGGLRNFAGRRR